MSTAPNPNPGGVPAGMVPAEVDQELFPDQETFASDQDAWSGGQAEAQMPIGTFQVEIKEAVLERSKSSSSLQIRYMLEVVGGEHHGKKIPKFDGLNTPQRAKISQQQLQRLGVDTSKVTLATLPAVLLDLQGKKAVVTGKMNPPYYNVNFQRIVDPNQAVGAPSFKAPASAAGGKPAGASAGRF